RVPRGPAGARQGVAGRRRAPAHQVGPLRPGQGRHRRGGAARPPAARHPLGVPGREPTARLHRPLRLTRALRRRRRGLRTHHRAVRELSGAGRMTTPEARLSPALRTEALEQLLTERGLVDPGVMDKFIANYETNVGPLNGAKVVAKAWTDPEYRKRLLAEGTS